MSETSDPGTDHKRKFPKLDAIDLRKLAEEATSFRSSTGKAAFGVVQDGELKIVFDNDRNPPENTLFEVTTQTVESRPAVDSVTIVCQRACQDLAECYDAVFWSEASVEKFLFPYYASASLWSAAAVLEKLEYNWYGRIPREPLDADAPPVDPASIPFAIAHTPDSNFVDLRVSPDPQHHLHLLFKTSAGVEAKPLVGLDEPPPGWRREGAAADRAPRTPGSPAAG